MGDALAAGMGEEGGGWRIRGAPGAVKKLQGQLKEHETTLHDLEPGGPGAGEGRSDGAG